MAVVAPMADEYRQLAGKSTTPLVHDIVCVHTMVGTLEGSISWSARAGGSYWHFGLGGKGKLVQCQDLRFRSAANLQGNWHVIPIETADIKEGVFPDTWQNPPWTNAQIDKLVDLIAWLCVRYNIPPVLIPDTKPGRRGLAYHRQGINPWRVDDGELWSNSNGKICPANRAVQFTSVVIPRVQQVLNPQTPPPPSPPEIEENDMLIVHPQTTASYFLLHGGKLCYIGVSEDIKDLQAVGVGTWHVTDRVWTDLLATYPRGA